MMNTQYRILYCFVACIHVDTLVSINAIEAEGIQLYN